MNDVMSEAEVQLYLEYTSERGRVQATLRKWLDDRLVKKNDTDIEKDDVLIVPLDAPTCEDCSALATCRITLDMRSAGRSVSFGPFCALCADHVSKRIKEGIPS